MRQWSFQTIEYFLKVAKTLNFSQAAKELYISPQSLNKQIQRFEEELGEPLFVRTTRHVELTLFGRYMQQMFEPVQEDYHRAIEGAERYLKRRMQTVRIAFFQAITKKEVVTPICNYLRAQERTVQIELFGGEIDDMIRWLYEDKCDLVITNIHDYEVWNDVEIIPFVTAPAQAVVSLYHPWAVKEKLTKRDMEDTPILLLEREKELEKDSFYRKLKVRERLYAANFNSLLANLQMEDCYAVIPKLFESDDRMNLRFMDLPGEYRFNFYLTVIYKKSHRQAKLFETLRTAAEEQILDL